MTVIFVYNANSGVVNTILDSAHKIVSPSSYSCHLCALTHDMFSEKKTWKTFVSNSEFDMHFYHRDEFKNEFGNQALEFPVILMKVDDGFHPLVSKEELESLESTEVLIEFLNSRLENGSEQNR